MLDWLLHLDEQLFYAINLGLANPVFDVVMPFVTSVRNWYAVYVGGLLLLVWKGGTKGRVCVLILLLVVSVSDQFNSRVLKEAVGRQRPSQTLSAARVVAPAAGGKSFPSTHATNNFAAALVLTIFYMKRAWLWYLVAAR